MHRRDHRFVSPCLCASRVSHLLKSRQAHGVQIGNLIVITVLAPFVALAAMGWPPCQRPPLPSPLPPVHHGTIRTLVLQKRSEISTGTDCAAALQIVAGFSIPPAWDDHRGPLTLVLWLIKGALPDSLQLGELQPLKAKCHWHPTLPAWSYLLYYQPNRW